MVEALQTKTAGGKGKRAPALGDGEKVKEGLRDTLLTSWAGSVRRRGAEEEEIYAFLAAVNSNRCTPPLDDDQVWKIAHSVAQYPPDKVPILIRKVVVASGRRRHQPVLVTVRGSLEVEIEQD
jgi:hypothetical protein